MEFFKFTEEEEQHLMKLRKENPDRIQEDLLHLKDWLKKQHHLPAEIGKFSEVSSLWFLGYINFMHFTNGL